MLAQSPLAAPETIRQAAREVVSRSYYELDNMPRRDAMPLLLRLLEWLMRPFKWLFDSMEGWPEFVRWIVVIVALIVCIALIAHIIYTLVKAIQGPVTRRSRAYTTARRELDPVDLEQQAESMGAMGDYMGAIRLLFRAALRRIELSEDKKIRPGCTNRELLRRYRATPLFGSLQRFVETIDLKWYGGAACDEADYAACRGEHARILEHVQATRSAVGA